MDNSSPSDTTSIPPDDNIAADTGSETLLSAVVDLFPTEDVGDDDIVESSTPETTSPSGELQPTDGSDPAPEEAPGLDDSEDELKLKDPDPEAAGEPEAEDEADRDLAGDDPSDRELASYKPKVRRRIEKLLHQRNAARQVASEAAPITEFMRRNDIPMQDVDVILQLSGKLRHGDFSGFLEGVKPYVDLALQVTGRVLPPDLQQKVNQGYVSREVASELAQRRAQIQVSQHQANQERERVQREQAEQRQRAVQFNAGVIRNAVIQWEATTKATDPDYGLKADVVRRTAQALIQQYGPPGTPERAVEYVKAAYAEANNVAQRFRPARPATSRTPSSVHQSATTPRAEPSSLMEAALLGLRQAG